MKKVTVTGACGFIGSNLVHKLVSKGYFVSGIDNLDNNLYSDKVKLERLSRLQNLENFQFSQLDIAKDNIEKVIEGSQYVINEAAIPGQVLSWDLFEKYVTANILGVKNIIDTSLKFNVERIVQASTSSVCGKFAVGDENLPTNPISPYGITKLAAEKLFFAMSTNTNLNFSILRYFSVYGPGQRPDMAIHKFLKSIKRNQEFFVTGDGTQKRDLTYVDDVVDATISSMKLPKENHIFNISGGRQYSLNEIIENIFEVTAKIVKINYVARPRGDQEETFGDNSKAKEVLNFQPSVELKSGLAQQFESI